ncbi:MAG: hypothetical protein HRU75_14335 [Planctomycetia bacterium]|nr:MAG: hypothetical protein HRU75_14335 [Planctomycetia bacterium]
MATPIAEFEHEGIRLVGSSLAGEETFVVAPELNIAFDVGRAQQELLAVDNVFLSHGHMDHAAGVAYYFSQRMFIDNQPGVVFAPEPLVDPLQRLMRLWAEIDGHEPAANIVAAVPDRDIPLRRDLVVRPFAVNHPCRRQGRPTVQALGFVAIEVRQKLKPEFVGLEGPQLIELKNRGEEITRTLELPLIAYCGDTAIGPWLDREDVRKARVLLLECTFVEPDHIDRARAGYHLHVRDLREIVPKLANERILLTHLSRRTALRDARAILCEQLGEEMAARLSFFMEFRRRGGRSQPATI